MSFEAGFAGVKLGAGDTGFFAEAGGVRVGGGFTTGVIRGAAEIAGGFTRGVVRGAAGIAGGGFATVALGNGFATGVTRGEMETAGVGDGG